MISKKAVHLLKFLILPLFLYLFLFNPLYNDLDKNICITTGSALFSILISVAELITAVLAMKIINRTPLDRTGFFSFSFRTLFKVIPSLALIWGIYLAGVLITLFVTGFSQDLEVITIELHSPLWILALMMLGIGYCEEFFFRIYLVDAMENAIGKKPAILTSAILFAIGHLYQGYYAVIIIFFLALGFQWIYSKYRNIHINAIVHGLFDVISILVKA